MGLCFLARLFMTTQTMVVMDSKESSKLFFMWSRLKLLFFDDKHNPTILIELNELIQNTCCARKIMY